MIIKKVSRTYSRSINTRNISANAPESWVRIEASMEAEVESSDDAKMVSEKIAEMCAAEVSTGITALSARVREAFEKPVATTVAPSAPQAAAPTVTSTETPQTIVAPVAAAEAPLPTAPASESPLMSPRQL